MNESCAPGRRAGLARLVNLGAGLVAAITVLGLILFLVASLFGGFRMATPLGLLSCREPARPLILALAGALLWTALERRRGVKPLPVAAHQGAGIRRMDGALVLLIITTILLWVRFVYRAYEPGFGGRPVSQALVKLIHPLFLFSGLGSVMAWRRRIPAIDGAALFAALFLALSPLRFHVSGVMVAGFALLAVAWILQPALEAFVTARCSPLHRLGFTVGLALLIAVAAHLAGLGWAGNRVQEHFAQRVAPGLAVCLLPLGGLGLWRSRGTCSRGWRLIGALGFWGLVLSGSRGEAGALGALLMLPVVSSLMAEGVFFLYSEWPLGRTLFGRNVVVLCLLGVLLGLVRDGLDRGIRSPYAPRPEAEAAGESGERQGPPQLEEEP